MSALIMMNMFMLQEHLEIQCNSYFFFTYTVSSFQVDIGVVCSVEILRNQCNRDSSMVRQAIWYLQQTHVLGKVHGGLITASPCFSLKVLPANLSHSKLDRINHMALLSSKAIEVFIVFLMTRKKKEEPTIYYITLKPAANLVLQHQVPVFSSQSPLWVVQHFILIWGILGIYYFIVSLTGGSAGSKERKSDFAFLLYKVEFLQLWYILRCLFTNCLHSFQQEWHFTYPWFRNQSSTVAFSLFLPTGSENQKLY